MSVRDFTERWTIPHQHDYVVADNGSLTGIVSLGMLRCLPERTWARTTLDQVTRKHIPVAWPDEHVLDVLQRMTENCLTVIPAVDPETVRFPEAVTRHYIVELVLSKGRR